MQDRYRIRRFEPRRLGTEEHVLVRLAREPEPYAVVDPSRERLELRPRALVGERELLARAACEAHATRETIDREHLGAHHLGERPVHEAQQELEVERAVLSLAEPQAVERVGVRLRLDVRDAVLVATDHQVAIDAANLQRALRDRKARAQQQPKEPPQHGPALTSSRAGCGTSREGAS